MNFSRFIRCIVSVALLTTASAHAQNSTDTIRFRGLVVDGPFKDQTIRGSCKPDLIGDMYKQQTRCVMRLSNGFKATDVNASLEVVGGFRALRIVIGPGMESGYEKGNFKLSVFEATTFYDREITLFDFPREFAAVEVSIAGVSIAGGTATTNPDCLIWDIVGDG